MSKPAVFLAVPALLGAGILGVVNVRLADELADTHDRVAELEAALRKLDDRVASPAPDRSGVCRDDARLRDLDERLARLESRGPAAALADTPEDEPAAAPGEPLAASGAPPAQLEMAVERVLDSREAERRLERREQMATRGVERLLKDVEVTDEQRASVQGIYADFIRKGTELRGQDLGPELVTERAAELRDELRRSLEAVLDAAQMEVVDKRLERRGGGDDGGARRRGGMRRGMAGRGARDGL